MGTRARLLWLAVVAGLAALAAILASTWGGGREGGWAEESWDSRPAEGSAAAGATAVARAAPGAEAPGSRAEATSAKGAASVASPDAALAEIRGRFLYATGGAASDVELTLAGSVWDPNRLPYAGDPKSWPRLEAVSDVEGRFRFRFEPSPALGFQLRARHAGSPQEMWYWHEISPGRVVDLGDLRLARAGAVAGRVLDAAGRPLADVAGVQGDASAPSANDAGQAISATALPNPVTAEFLLEGLPPGLARLTASHPMVGTIEGPVVPVNPGETGRYDIAYRGPDLARRIVVSGRVEPSLPIAPKGLRLVGAGSEAIAPSELRGAWAAFDGLDPNKRYTAELADPDFQTWAQSGLRPGEWVKATFTGSAALALDVRGADGAPVEPYRFSLRIRPRVGSMHPDTFEVRKRGKLAPDGGIYLGMPPGDCDVIVEAAGFARASVPVDALAPGETRRIAVQLLPGAAVRGRVVHADRATQAAGVRVALEILEAGKGNSVVRDPYAASLRWTATGADGTYRFGELAPGAYRVVAGASDLVRAEGEARLAAGGGDATIDLVLPSHGSIVGILQGPPGRPWQGVRIEARPKAWGYSVDRSIPFSSTPFFVVPSEQGAFRFAGVPPGPCELVLRIEGGRARSGTSIAAAPGHFFSLGSVEVPEGGEARAVFDLRDRFPGAIELWITSAGVPAPGLVVEALGNGRHLAETDAAGVARLAPLAPGDWELVIRPAVGRWRSRWPEAVQLAPGGELRLDLDLPIVEGKMTILDAEGGAPVAEGEVHVRGDAGSEWRLLTGRDGSLAIELPAGTYRFQRPGATEADVAIVRWERTGPVPSVLRLRQRE